MKLMQLTPRHRYLPLLGFVLSTLIIGYGFVIPASCIAGVNELSLGFAMTVFGACIAYWMGLRTVELDGDGDA